MRYKINEWEDKARRLKRFYNISTDEIQNIKAFMDSIPDNYGEITFTQEGKEATFKRLKDFDKYIKKVEL